MRSGSTADGTKGASVQQPQKFDGWLAFIDIYGFRGVLNGQIDIEAYSRLQNYQEALLDNFKKKGFRSFFVFSDTVVIWIREGPKFTKKFRRFLEICSDIQFHAAANLFALRGAITFGEIIVSNNYILGDAYMRAYYLESRMIKNPQICISEDELVKGDFLERNLELRSIDAKDGDAILAHVINVLPADTIEKIASHNITLTFSNESPERRILYEPSWRWLFDQAEQLRGASHDR